MTHSAFVTGGGSGIGLACARQFVQQGAAIGLMGRTETKLLEAEATILNEYPQATVKLFVGDTADEASVSAALKQLDTVAPLTKVVANAGVGGLAPVAAQDADQYDDIMRTTVKGTLLVFKHASRHLAQHGGGAMCAISSIAGLRTHPYMAAYCMSKAAIDMLVRNCADELGGAGIRVNSVSGFGGDRTGWWTVEYRSCVSGLSCMHACCAAWHGRGYRGGGSVLVQRLG